MLDNNKELEILINKLDLELLDYTNDSAVYDNCEDAIDLINHDSKAKKIYYRIIELVSWDDFPEELKEILQTYDIEISNYHQQIKESNN